MKIILAADLKDGQIVHGKSGNREEYKPLNWGLSPTAEPVSYTMYMKPKYLYAADLDRIELCGDHTETILKLADKVSKLYVDRGISIPEEYLPAPIVNIVGTETADSLEEFSGGLLSVDVKDGHVIPCGEDVIDFLKKTDNYSFDGVLILNISSVGTSSGVDEKYLTSLRNAVKKPLYYGGGVSSLSDLDMLCKTGFDGAVISTAVHLGKIPLNIIQEGEYC